MAAAPVQGEHDFALGKEIEAANESKFIATIESRAAVGDSLRTATWRIAKTLLPARSVGRSLRIL